MKISKLIPNAATRKVATQVLALKKNSPHIFFTAGIVGVVGGTVLACRATLKLNDVLAGMDDDVNSITEMNEEGRYDSSRAYKKELAYAYVKGTGEIARLYGPAVVVTGLSVVSLTGSHVALVRRNTALTAAYAGVQKAYDEYRNRVREVLGEEKELDIYHAAQDEKVKIDGKPEVVKVVNPNAWSPYARFFDEASPEWRKDPEHNRIFVQCQQNYLNDRLKSRGHVFLNEAYDALGLERSSAGQVVGWLNVDDGERDTYIDFGIFEAWNSAFVNGHERSILLDFNVDGIIYNQLG